jgi:hypothetical protein
MGQIAIVSKLVVRDLNSMVGQVSDGCHATRIAGMVPLRAAQ